MTDFFEIDFLDVESKKSGDAISLRYKKNGSTYIHVVDGGFQATGDTLVKHIRKYYDNPQSINHVVATHPDGDHAGGLRTVLEEFEIGALWMNRPWLYVDELIHKFSKFSNIENLRKRLKEVYPNIATLEEIAEGKNIPIYEAFQGMEIGAFTVMTPTKARLLDLIVESEKTPESTTGTQAQASLGKRIKRGIAFIRAVWGEEIFSPEETSAENEMSIVQFGNLCDEKILLTGDTGRGGLDDAADYADAIGAGLPGIDRFQVPHHGSRRNVSTETLDRWLGPRFDKKIGASEEKCITIISAAKEDEDHPRKAVVRACIHRGARAISTEGATLRVGKNAPNREGWISVTPLSYPEDQEE